MYYLFSVITGVLIAIMIVANGKLAGSAGVYLSTVIVHIVGLAFVSIIYLLDKKSQRPKKKLPFYLYTGGLIGVATVVFNTFAYSKISVSALLALGLLGQSITSIFFDQFGWFDMPKVAFKKRKIVGLAFVLIGIFIMISLREAKEITAIILSLLTGLTVVLSRTINAKLAQETSVVKGAMYTNLVGLITAIFILLISVKGGNLSLSFTLPSNLWVYTGGIIGVFTIVILNVTVAKISSFYLTLLLFVGQVFSGIVIDMISAGSFSFHSLVGGLFVTAGLCLNVWFDKLSQQKHSKTCDNISNNSIIVPEKV